jgi:hypothetical protein
MFALLVVGALAIGADGDVPLKELGIALPKTIGELRYKGRHEYGDGLGYSVAYFNKMCLVTIYVYDRGQKGIPAGKAGQAVKDELKASTDEMAVAEKNGAYKNLKRMDGQPPLPEAVLAKFAAAGYTFDIQGGGCKSYVLVTGHNGHFIKVRATQYVVDGKTNDAEFNPFLEAVARHLKGLAK